MTNREIGNELNQRIRVERHATNEILRLINLALERRAYLEFGFSSMFDWLVEGFGYSNAAAYRRIEAAKLLKAVPEIESKLVEGTVNLTTISKAQSVIRAQEKAEGKKIDLKSKAEVVEKIENKSSKEAEQTLLQIFPEAAEAVQQERKTVVNADQTRLHVNLPNEIDDDLQRAKEILSHQIPNGEIAKVLAHVLKFFLDKEDPLRQKSYRTTPSAAEGTAQRMSRRSTIQSSHARCTFRDPITGRICGSRYQLQIDHIVPKALGGNDDRSNLRTLCRQHNFHAAEQAFGKQHMSKFRRPDR